MSLEADGLPFRVRWRTFWHRVPCSWRDVVDDVRYLLGC